MQRFTGLAKDLDKLLKASGSEAHVYTLMGADSTRAHLTDTLNTVAREAKPEDDFVLILIGHGTYDGVEYKFNLVGPDISAEDLASLCDHIPSKRQLIVNTTSASGGSIPALQKPGRAVIAATKSGTEKNATVFARYWVEALQDPTADTDKNEAISALEAFQYADRKTAEFYDSQKRLATEHPDLRGHWQRSARSRCRRPTAAKACCSPPSRFSAWAPHRRLRTIRPSANCSPRKKSWNRRLTS